MSPSETSKSQAEVVIDGIRQLLSSGQLSPKSRLPVEKDLAQLLGVSRGSLREGIRALAALGIVETRQGDGTYITSLDPYDLLGSLRFLADTHPAADSAHLLAVRRVLESESAASAALLLTEEQLAEIQDVLDEVEDFLSESGELDLKIVLEADMKFHSLIAKACGNPPLAALIDSLGSRTQRARVWRAINEKGAVQSAHNDHKSIFLELKARQPERARIRMSNHLLGMEEFAATQIPDDI